MGRGVSSLRAEGRDGVPGAPSSGAISLGTQDHTQDTHLAVEPRGSRHHQVQDLGVSVTGGVSEHPLPLGSPNASNTEG